MISRRKLMGYVALSGLVFLIWNLVLGDALSDDPVNTAVRGGVADWLVVREGMSGDNAYAAVSPLAEEWLGLSGLTPNTSHPRPPSAITVMIPLGAVSPGAILHFLAAVMAISLVFTVVLLTEWLGYPNLATWVIALVVGATSAVIQGVAWGGHIPLAAAALLLWVTAPERGKTTATSVAAGVSIALKLFPALIVLVGARSAPRRALLPIAVFGVLTLVGLALPGVDLGGSWSAMSNAPSAYGDTMIDFSLAAQLDIEGKLAFLIPLAAVALVPWLASINDVRERTSLAMIVMLLASPVAWPEYQLFALPTAMYLWQRSPVGRVVAAL